MQQGPSSITTLAPLPHALIVQIGREPELLFQRVASSFQRAFARGDPMVAVSDYIARPHIAERMRAQGIDLAEAVDRGQLLILKPEPTLAQLLVGERLDWARFKAFVGARIEEKLHPHGSPRLFVYGEMVDMLFRDGNLKAASDLGEFWNAFASLHSLELLRGYVAGNFYYEAQGEDFLRICHAHCHVQPMAASDESIETDLRQVSLLQQRARALETELQHRKQLEDALRVALDGQASLLASERAARAESENAFEQARQAREAAEAASRAKDQFLAMLGHELCNPLAPIVTALQLIKMKSSGENSDREHQIIERHVQHMIRLVDDLLDASRLSRGQVGLKKTKLELSQVITQAIELASPLLEEKRHHLELEVPREGMLLQADESRLTQVFANLLTNAARYTGAGGKISVVASRERDELLIRVKDNGVGIAPELLPKMFELFVQGHRSPARSEGGVGLGLALVRSLVELHGGRVRAESAGLGKGSEFMVYLPAQSPGEIVPQRSRAAADARRPETKNMQHRRILVVDDNIDAAELTSELLQALGHEVQTAHDGPNALKLLESFDAEVAILDLGLPVMDGYELAQRIRALHQPTPPRLIALSGYGQEQDRKKSQQSGFSRHLVKPVELEELANSVLELAPRTPLSATLAPANSGVN